MEYKGSDSPPPYHQMPSEQTSPQLSPSVVLPPVIFTEYPVQVTCANCGQSVTTTVVKANGTCSYLTALAVLLVCFPFFWVPLVIDACKDYRHFCPSCNAMLGVYKKI